MTVLNCPVKSLNYPGISVFLKYFWIYFSKEKRLCIWPWPHGEVIKLDRQLAELGVAILRRPSAVRNSPPTTCDRRSSRGASSSVWLSTSYAVRCSCPGRRAWAAAPAGRAARGPAAPPLTAVHEHREVLTQTAMALTKGAEASFIPLKHASASLGVPNEA